MFNRTSNLQRRPRFAASMTLAATLTALMTASLPAGVSGKGTAMIDGQDATQRTYMLLSQVHWHDSLEAAKRQSEIEGKPIFLMHMLGSLSGGT